ncbi:methyltransferase domain-containing protein [Streptomyces sp. NPDC056084]|uniref:class I SAM-dependent methyltransferase n=1 Tax=unclassified Streptomyces TaxID=2593676 RepID=UPI0035D73A70
MHEPQFNQQAWETFGRHHLNAETVLPEAERIDWALSKAGPGTEILGPLTGKLVLDLGSGTGRHAAHLARDHGAIVDAVDNAPAQHQRAVSTYGHIPRLRFHLDDALNYLDSADAYDIIYAVNSLSYLPDPPEALAAVADALAPGGRFVFSVLHTTTDLRPPSTSVVTRPETLRIRGGEDLTVRMYVLTAQLWADMAHGAGLQVDQVITIESPDDSNPVSYRLLVTSRA